MQVFLYDTARPGFSEVVPQCNTPVRLEHAGRSNWIARLSDVAPDGISYLVSRGYLNGTHGRSYTQAEPLRNGEVYEITRCP